MVAISAHPSGWSREIEIGYATFRANCITYVGDIDIPLDAVLGVSVAWDKPNGFSGREALQARRDDGIPRCRLIQPMLVDATDAAPLLHHEEPILRDGQLVGLVLSGAWGHQLGRSLGMGYV